MRMWSDYSCRCTVNFFFPDTPILAEKFKFSKEYQIPGAYFSKNNHVYLILFAQAERALAKYPDNQLIQAFSQLCSFLITLARSYDRPTELIHMQAWNLGAGCFVTSQNT